MADPARDERLRRRASRHFLVLLSRGPRRGRDEAGPRPRLGVTASRKVGGAVVRSRVKRCIREAFRAERAALPRGADVVVIARRGAEALASGEVAAELAALFRAEPRR